MRSVIWEILDIVSEKPTALPCKMKAVGSYNTSVNTSITLRINLEVQHLKFHRRENLKSQQ